MESSTHIYIVPGVLPTEIVIALENEYDRLANLLNIDTTLETPSTEGFFEEIEDFPVPNSLDSQTIQHIFNFSNTVLGANLLDLETKYIPTDDNLLTLLKLRRLLAEQLGYIDSIEENCRIWFITASLNGYLYGGVFVFWNPRYPNHVVMQGISKFLTPSLLALLYPEQESKLPRLNSLLQSAVETVAQNIGAAQIYVSPVGKQGAILEKHYGYRRTSNIIYPCNLILGSEAVSISHGIDYTYYVKDIPSEE